MGWEIWITPGASVVVAAATIGHAIYTRDGARDELLKDAEIIASLSGIAKDQYQAWINARAVGLRLVDQAPDNKNKMVIGAVLVITQLANLVAARMAGLSWPWILFGIAFVAAAVLITCQEYIKFTRYKVAVAKAIAERMSLEDRSISQMNELERLKQQEERLEQERERLQKRRDADASTRAERGHSPESQPRNAETPGSGDLRSGPDAAPGAPRE